MLARDLDMHGRGDFLFSGMRARGNPDRTIADPALQGGEFRRIGRKGSCRRFEISNARRAARPKGAEP